MRSCGHKLRAETQRGHIYYRCHTRTCRGTCVREEAVTEDLTLPLSYLPMSPVLGNILREEFGKQNADQTTRKDATRQQLNLQLGQIAARRNRLTDLFIDEAIDQARYEARKTALHNEELGLQDELARLGLDDPANRAEKFVEHVLALQNLAGLADPRKFRETLRFEKSNIIVTRKCVEIQWSNALLMLTSISVASCCVHMNGNEVE